MGIRSRLRIRFGTDLTLGHGPQALRSTLEGVQALALHHMGFRA